VIAEHIGGSQQAFVDLMNQSARELKCSGTRFMNAHGLHDPQQVTTARDMARIMLAAMELPEFMTIFGTARYTVPATNSSEARYLTTVNLMLDEEYRFSYYDRRVTGGRSGVTEDDKRSFVATSANDDVQYISVVLGATPEYRKDDPKRIRRHGSFEDTATLLTMGFQAHSSSQLLYRGQIIEQYRVSGGENDIVVGPEEDLSCIFPGDATADQLVTRIQMVTDRISAPVKKGDLIAVMQVWYGNVCVAQAELLAKNSSAISQMVIRQEQEAQKNFDAGAFSTAMTVLIVIAVLIVGLSVGVFLLRIMRRPSATGRGRRRRRSR
jgi:D-alanyl-D-alanine carboxypeptidase (penicillin-binding protein 5/6)